jgi:hypothetical protein
MGPLTVPDLPRKRRWGWLLVWTLLVFAGGVAAGPILTEQAFLLVERASSMLGMAPPQFVQKFKPAGPSIEPLPAPVVEQAPAAAARVEPAPTPAEPVAPQAVKPAESEPPVVAQLPAGRGENAAAARTQPAETAAPAARSAHTKGEARGASHRAAPSAKAPNAETPAPAAVGFKDPFAEGAPSPPKAAASGRKSSPSFDESARPAKSEPAAKPAASSSHDSLDNLMADVVTDSKGKDKPRENKSLDALLKDVQKGKPEAPPKQEAAAPLPQLSQADISRVMAGVRTRGKDCAHQLGQKGIAELTLVVGKEGRVTQVSVGGNVANTPLAACIEKAVRAASFPRSAGLRFDYRLDVRQ